ncbi:MAG: type I DNA topoisomerase [Thermodesulfobacteriota bacterium]
MAKNLVVVESPAKAKTLAKYLGRNYQVRASVGHILDLPKSKLGVDVENDFAPDYSVIPGKAKIITELRKAAKEKETIFLAPDPDREGEAIAWHIAEKIGVPRSKLKRVLFNEITKDAVRRAIENPQPLNKDRYDAQQARRVLDRLVGYQVSPLLWKKVRRGLSAGRVQSVAVRIIVEREREIRAFVPVEYWSITARLEGDQPPAFDARLVEVAGKRLDPKGFRVENEEQAKAILQAIKSALWIVRDVETKERKRNPQPPFITSRLQQEASRKLSFSPKRTMGIAQKLYEGVELGSEGAVGLITYMRTDSTRVSPEAQAHARDFVASRYGQQYLPKEPPVYRSRKQAQDAHEAIRPTSMEYTPERVERFLDPAELRLYTLIWNRFVASQMAPAVYDQTAVDIPVGEYLFRANGQVMKFDGFMRVYTEGTDEKAQERDESAEPDSADDRQLPPLKAGDHLKLLDLSPEQHFTQPPPRFTQATLIKELEEKGIGRPSTYASIMGTILEKDYVTEDDSRRLRPTELGALVTDLLVEAFPDIFNVEFTAGMEEVLDTVEEGANTWVSAVRNFYDPFTKDLEHADEHMRDVKTQEIPTDLTCERCGAPMVIKWGRRGEFIACTNYPECRNTKNFKRRDDGSIEVAKEETIDRTCPKCGRPMQIKFGRFGKFVGCTGYPECREVQPLKLPEPIGMKCPDCGVGDVVQKFSRKRKLFYSCNRYPDCTFSSWDKPIPEPCPQCGGKFLVEKVTKRAGAERKCPNPECSFREAAEAAVA